MKVFVQHIRSLLTDASRKAGTTQDFAGFGRLSEKINEVRPGHEITQRYLYENMYSQAAKAENKGEDQIGLNLAYLHVIARYLGYEDYEAFVQRQQSRIPTQLSNCFGNWYSYVRDSSGRDVLLRSPVQLYEEEGKAMMKLQGRDRLFRGEVSLRSGGLFCLLRDEALHKEMHEVYKIGLLQKPELLIGVFSAISSMGHPVAGRKVLWRTSRSFDELKIGRIALSECGSLQAGWPSAIVRYFRPFDRNYIRITDTEDVVVGKG